MRMTQSGCSGSRRCARSPLAQSARCARFRRRRRMARAYGQQARRADGARARSPSSFSPWARDLGLSATLGNLEEARRVLLDSRDAAQGALVEGRIDKPLSIDTLLPKSPERFPWAGHLGAKMVEPIVAEI